MDIQSQHPAQSQITRRGFPAGSAAISAGLVCGSRASAAAAFPTPPNAPATTDYSADEQRRRLKNIAYCNREIRTCLRRHLVTDYLPGQAVYNLGEYPCWKIWDPDDWDEQQLQELASHGVELVHVHEEWNDSQRLFGGRKFAPANDQGFRRFVEMCHRAGLRIIPYVSTGFFDRRDLDFREEWASSKGDLVELYFHYARCSPASPGWRAYLLPRLRHILDEYGVDGFYNDVGYYALHRVPENTVDEIRAFEESATEHGAFEDLLAIVYGMVKQRGGVLKLHSEIYYRDSLRPPV